jgi:hypothetical protein
MLYLLAIALPPLALLMAGAPVQALLNLILFVASIVLAIFTFGTLWVICVIWALVVVHNHYNDVRVRRAVEDAVRRNPSR